MALQNAGNDLNFEMTAHKILARSFTALGQADNASREQAWLGSHVSP
jgi:hypothetical protein